MSDSCHRNYTAGKIPDPHGGRTIDLGPASRSTWSLPVVTLCSCRLYLSNMKLQLLMETIYWSGCSSEGIQCLLPYTWTLTCVVYIYTPSSNAIISNEIKQRDHTLFSSKSCLLHWVRLCNAQSIEMYQDNFHFMLIQFVQLEITLWQTHVKRNTLYLVEDVGNFVKFKDCWYFDRQS